MPSDRERITRLETQMQAVDKMIRAADEMIRTLAAHAESQEEKNARFGASMMILSGLMEVLERDRPTIRDDIKEVVAASG